MVLTVEGMVATPVVESTAVVVFTRCCVTAVPSTCVKFSVHVVTRPTVCCAPEVYSCGVTVTISLADLLESLADVATTVNVPPGGLIRPAVQLCVLAPLTETTVLLVALPDVQLTSPVVSRRRSCPDLTVNVVV